MTTVLTLGASIALAFLVSPLWQFHGVKLAACAFGALAAIHTAITWLSVTLAMISVGVNPLRQSRVFLAGTLQRVLVLTAYPISVPLGFASAIVGGNTIYGPFKVFMTHDADFTAYQVNPEDVPENHDHAWGPECGLLDRWLKRTRWLSRNKFYTGSAVLFGREGNGHPPIASAALDEHGTKIWHMTDVDGAAFRGCIYRWKFVKIKMGWSPHGPQHKLWFNFGFDSPL